jgi:hypothetical protein
MWFSLLILAGVAFLAAGCQGDKAKVDLDEGQWEITTEIKMDGMPFQLPPLTHTQCITHDDLVPVANKSDKCEVANLEVENNTVSYDIICSEEGRKMTSHSSITYEKDTMEGSMTATMEPGNRSMSYTLAGRRVGDCPK